MSVFDYKRYYLSDGIRPYAFVTTKCSQAKAPPGKNLKTYIEMNECEAISELVELLNSEIEETYSPPDHGFWRFSAKFGKAVLKMSIYNFRSRGRAVFKETTFVA